MITLSASQARKSFFRLMHRIQKQNEVFKIKHHSGNLVILSAEQYVSIQETLYLLSAPNFLTTFEQSVKEADAHQVVSFDEVFEST